MRPTRDEVVRCVRRDHADLVRMLDALVAPETSVETATTLVESLGVALRAHADAQIAVVDGMLKRIASPPALLGIVVAQVRGDHRRHLVAFDGLAGLAPRSSAWMTCMLELRSMVWSHERREIAMLHALSAHFDDATRRDLARGYTTERLHRVVPSKFSLVETFG